MKSKLLLLLIGWSLASIAQTEDAFVYFNTKPNATYYLENPLEILSERALLRRQNQNISLDVTDVPIHMPYVTEVGNSVLVLAQSKWLNAVYVRGDYQTILDLNDFTFVEKIEFANKNLNFQEPKIAPMQKSSGTQQSLDVQNFLYGDSANQIQMHNGEYIHQEGFTGSGKIIAVIDTGFEGVNTTIPFQRLFDNNLILGGYNFVLRNNNIFTGGNHGTRVLSVIGGYQENQLIGTAPDSAFYLFVTEDTTSESPLEEALWVEAAEMADSLGVDIINTSLGYDTFDNPNHNHSYEDLDGNTTFISRGLNVAFSKGMLCVTSAGNSGNSDWMYIATPADAQGSLTVGAVTSTGEYAGFSSIGPTIDQRIKPDVVGQGVVVVNANQFGTVSVGNGTSFSAPIISGLAACLWSAYPELDNAQLMQIIKESSHLYQNPNYLLGYGIPNFYQAFQNASLYVKNHSTETVMLYPNPANEFISFQGNIFDEVQLKIFDISGKIILQQRVMLNEEIDIRNLTCGIYLYQLNTINNIQTGKIIKK